MKKFFAHVCCIMCFAFFLCACNSAGGGGEGEGNGGGGIFWAVYTVADPGCVDLGDGVEACDERRLDRVEIIEESTAEILGMCQFGEYNLATTGPDSNGAEFRCERSGPDGSGAYTVKVSSKQANLPWLHTYITRISDDGIMWETYVQASGGLNGPDGTVYADPYSHKQFDFAGDKTLIFKTESDKDYSYYMQHALQPLLDAGYTAWSRNFQATNPGFIGEILVSDTLNGRLLLGEDKIERIWQPVRNTSDTRGNKGTFEFNESCTCTLSGGMSLTQACTVIFSSDAQFGAYLYIEPVTGPLTSPKCGGNIWWSNPPSPGSYTLSDIERASFSTGDGGGNIWTAGDILGGSMQLNVSTVSERSIAGSLTVTMEPSVINTNKDMVTINASFSMGGSFE